MVTAGGKTWTFTGFNLKLENALYWGPSPSTVGYPSPADLAFDGTVDAADGEGMTYDAVNSNLAGGIQRWTGTAPFNGGTWSTRLTITVTDTSGAALALTDAASLGITGVGAVLKVTGDFKANMTMEAAPPPGTTYGAPAPQYDAATHPMSGGTLLSSFDGGFYVQQPLVMGLPAMSNGAYGGYVTATYLQNTGPATANVVVKYFDQTGSSVGAGDTATIASKAGAIIRQDNGHSFLSGVAGSALAYSDQPLAGFVNEFPPGGTGDATSYSAIQYPAGVGTTLYAPAIASTAYGGYTTGIGLVNLGIVPANITITYRDTTGAVQSTQTLNAVPAGAYRGVYSGNSGSATDANLPAGFAGTATVTTSTAFPVAAIVNEAGPGGQFSSYDAISAGHATLYAPAALRNAYGGYNTGMGIQNTTATAGTVTITYYNSAGVASTTSHSIAANGYLGIYQGTDIPSDGPYTAVINTATVGVTLVGIVNEVAPATGPNKQSTSYNTFAGGAATVYLPLVESAGPDGWSTGLGIMNSGSTTTTVTVSYYDTSTGAAIGAPQANSLAANAYWGVYQPVSGLPNGMRATAVITTSSGGQVSVIANESNASTFMSYDGVGG